MGLVLVFVHCYGHTVTESLPHDADCPFEQAVSFIIGNVFIPLTLSTTVADRRLAAAIRAFDSGSRVHGIGVVFASETSRAGVQRRAILATAGE